MQYNMSNCTGHLSPGLNNYIETFLITSSNFRSQKISMAVQKSKSEVSAVMDDINTSLLTDENLHGITKRTILTERVVQE